MPSLPELHVHSFALGALQTNGYLLADADSNAVMIDIGGDVEVVDACLQHHNYQLQAVWLTHAHFDHVAGLSALLAKYPVPFYMHPDGHVMLTHAVESAARWGIPIPAPPQDFTPLQAGQSLQLGEHTFTCLFTPGHAPGHIAFYHPAGQQVFAGDALFKGSIGRTDLPLSNPEQLLRSIREQLLVLPEETRVYPGHGDPTTIAAEKTHNPFLQ